MPFKLSGYYYENGSLKSMVKLAGYWTLDIGHWTFEFTRDR